MSNDKIVPFAPNINSLGVPPSEREAAWYIRGNLGEFRHQALTFEDAVRLADYLEPLLLEIEAKRVVAIERAVDPKHFPALDALNDERARYSAWIAVACRDAAMTLRHVDLLLEALASETKQCPTIYALVDWKRFKEARKLFDKHFPGVTGMRNAAGHAVERTIRPQKEQKHAFTGHHIDDGLRILGSSQITMTMLRGRKLTMTWSKKVFTVEISGEHWERLKEVVLEVYAAFEPVRSGLTGIDLGD